MKYSILLRILRGLMYGKRALWWLGQRFLRVLERFFYHPYRLLIYVRYKCVFILKRLGIRNGLGWLLKRDFLQVVVFIGLCVVSLPHTRVLAKKDPLMAGKKTIAYQLTGPDEESDVEEISAELVSEQSGTFSPWRQGAIENFFPAGSGKLFESQDLTNIVAGGAALTKPIIIPGSTVGRARDRVIAYKVEPGDSLGAIAFEFGVSIPTIMWENNLTLRSIIRPGDILRIPPITGVIHIIKKGDTLKKIANLYDVKTEDIIGFNHLKDDGTGLVIGESVIIPGGVRPQERATTPSIANAKNLRQLARRLALPPVSPRAPSLSGFVWPTLARLITQYFGWKHHALDVAGPWQTPNYAAKAGTVEKSQCGWNSGYGCYIIIDHGGGVKTLYGHNSQLLVSAGDVVQAGQPIGLMGNTGRVRGITGIHLHFEIIINGVRVNPLGYVR